ncbi:MAG: hypothetical protein ACO1SV_25950 [Fimbriimonas sp.]
MKTHMWMGAAALFVVAGCGAGTSEPAGGEAPQQISEPVAQRTPEPPAPEREETPPPVDTPSVPVDETSESTAPSSTSMPEEPTSATPAKSALTDRFTVKTRMIGVGALPEFRLTVNGSDLSFGANGETDITSFLNPGKNELVLRWEPSIEGGRSVHYASQLTVGMLRDGKWSTVVNQRIPQSIKEPGSKTYTIMAR